MKQIIKIKNLIRKRLRFLKDGLHWKIIIILLIGIMMFTATMVRAGDPLPGLDITIEQIPGGELSIRKYDYSLSSKSIGELRMEIGNTLISYGVGGAKINEVTDALEGSGIYEAELELFLMAIGIDEKAVQAILIEFDKLGIAINEEGLQAIFTPDSDTADTTLSTVEGDTIKGDTSESTSSWCPNTGSCSVGTICVKGICVPDGKESEVSTPATEVEEKTAEEPAAFGTGDTSESTSSWCPDTGSCSVGTICVKGICVPDGKESEISIPGAEDTPQLEVKAKAILLIKMEEKAISTPDTGDLEDTSQARGGDPLKGLNISCATKPNHCKKSEIEESSVELLKLIAEMTAIDASLTEINARRVIEALIEVSPAFTIDKDGLPEKMNKASLIEAIASNANLTKADAKKALDAFVEATIKSAPALYKLLTTGERIALVGSGSFSISKLKARTGGIQTLTEEVLGESKEEEMVVRKTPGRTKYASITLKRTIFQDDSNSIIQNIISAATPEERKKLINELKATTKTFQTEIITISLQTRMNAKVLRENFEKTIVRIIGHVDHGKAARLKTAHARSLRMLNRLDAAITRFGNLINRLESRIKKLEDRGVDTSSVILLMEEAENMKVGTEATMEILKEKYESLLDGENLQGIGNEAREIAQKLKIEIQNLHTKLSDIVNAIKQATRDYNSSISNSSSALKIILIQNTIEKIQERLKSCDNIDVCDIVERHAEGREGLTATIKKAIENKDWEEATRLLREVRGVIVGDIELLEGVENIGSIADVLELERSLLNHVDLALISI